MSSPASLPVQLMALEKAAKPAAADDAMLRSAIVNVTSYYLQMAKTKSPAEMEAIIWQHDSVDGANHGESCAAFASMTLELAAQVVGQQSWVTGGTSYPWPLHEWADVRVDPNPASLGITSVLQDAEAHGRWHPLGDGYQPQPGDWVLFDGHVEVITSYADGVLHTIGGDSLPDFSVNAHEFDGPLSAQGVAGFVDNGVLAATAASAPAGREPASGSAASPAQDAAAGRSQAAPGLAAIPGAAATGSSQAATARQSTGAAIPGMPAPPSSAKGNEVPSPGQAQRQPAPGRAASGQPAPGRAASGQPAQGTAAQGTAAIPGVPVAPRQQPAGSPAPSPAPYGKHRPSSPAMPANGTKAQQAFIGAVAPGAVAAQRKYGVPASVTIAQAIDESSWGQSDLATRDHNLFGIKGTGPAGSDLLPTQEYGNGQWVTQTAPFRVYNNVAESIDDHGKLLATSGYYSQAMAQCAAPNAFAAALTGVYATDPGYGATLIDLMRRYNLYRYDTVAPAAVSRTATPAATPAATPHTTTPTAPRQAASPAATPQTTPATPPTTPATPPSVTPPGTPTATPAVAPHTTQPAAPAVAPHSTATSAPHGTPAVTLPAASAATSQTPPAAASPATTSPAAPRTATPPAPLDTPTPATGTPRPTATGTPSPRATASPSPTATASPSPTATASPSPTATRSPTATATSGAAEPGAAAPGSAAIPGVPDTQPAPPAAEAPPAPSAAPKQGRLSDVRRPLTQSKPSAQAVSARLLADTTVLPARRIAARSGQSSMSRYQQHIPQPVMNAFITTARVPLIRAEPLYQDVASDSGIRWELLAACDWMQCRAHPRYSPVHGEKLRTVNPDGTVYRTRSEALAQCVNDLIELSATVYQIDLTADEALSIRDLANVFTAFRWGGLLKLHHTSAMEFPYSVAGLTAQHVSMRWPDIDEPNAPDKPGGRFRRPFGAVPIVLGLGYPATV
jgi:flagellum-specific peptidoglycan hydrolase FlgJ